MHPLFLETPSDSLRNRYRLYVAALVISLHHFDHALDFIEDGLALGRDVLRGVDRACRSDTTSIVDAEPDLLEDQGVGGDGPRNALNLDFDIRDFNADSVEHKRQSEPCAGNLDDGGVGSFAASDASVI